MNQERTIKLLVDHETNPRPQRLRSQLTRYAHATASALIGLCLPVAVALGTLALYEANSILLNTMVGKLAALLIFACGLVGSFFKCDHKYLLGALLTVCSAAAVPPELGVGAVAVSLALFAGLAISHGIYGRLRSGHQPSEDRPAHELNPKCGTCHARSFCPFQPGGFADRYSAKDGATSRPEADQA